MIRHLGNLTIEQQSKLDKLRNDLQNAGYIDRTDDSTLVYIPALPFPSFYLRDVC